MYWEVRLHAGPLFVGEDYVCRRRLLAVGETPKAEFRWTRSFLWRGETLVAEMTLQERLCGMWHREVCKECIICM